MIGLNNGKKQPPDFRKLLQKSLKFLIVIYLVALILYFFALEEDGEVLNGIKHMLRRFFASL